MKRRAFFSAMFAAPAAATAQPAPRPTAITYEDRGYAPCCTLCGASVMAERCAADPYNYMRGAIHCSNPGCQNYHVYAAFPKVVCEVLPDFKPQPWENVR